ncbi:MAG: peptidylprolyl isomerase [Nitrospinae bacterium]|nr:peptidylprolyl isomerase [Nitrospinota bacterium]
MLRRGKKIFWLSLVLANALIAAGATTALAHSAHKDEAKLQVALPDVVAKVNGENIRKDGIVRELKLAIGNYKARGMPLTADQEKIAAKKLIDDEIGRTLLFQKGREIGVKVTDQMMNSKLQQIKSSFRSDAVFEHELKDRGITLEQYRKELKIDLMMQQVIDQEIEPKIEISEDEIKTYYEKNKGQFRSRDKARASVILIKTRRGDAASEKAAQKKIESIRNQIENGADFGELAKKHSQDSLARKGGDLGYFTKNQMFGAFSSRAFAMEVGEVSEAFKTGHGFHLLKLTDRKPGDALPLEKAEKSIKKAIKEKKMRSATREYVGALKQKADVKMYF